MARDRDDRRSGGKSKKSDNFTKTIFVGPFRMAFVSLLEPEEDDYGNERYKLTALFPPDYPKKKMQELEDALYEVFEHKFGEDQDDWPNGRNDVTPDMKLYDAGTKKYAGFTKGWTACSMSSVEQPGIIDADKNEVMSKREIYAGRWARAQVTISAYDNKSKGVGVYLNHVQLLDHDEAFTGRGRAEDVFDKAEMKDRRENRRDDRDDEENERGSRRSRSRDRDEDRDEDRQESRSRDRGRRSRDEDEEDTRESRSRDRGRGNRDRDEDAEEEDRKPQRTRRSMSDEDAEDRSSNRRRSRDEDDEQSRDSGKRSRDNRRSRSSDDDWN